MISEEDFIQISALQHYVYCPRQCGLIHVEDVWNNNVYTVRGNILHEKVDTDTYESRGALKTVRGLRVHSSRLGIVGRCDVVEFLGTASGNEKPSVMPVEFKAGQPKDDISDKVQLCAQALCLEEMLDVDVLRGALFYGRIRRREQVEIDANLRVQTEGIISAVHDLVSKKIVPVAEYSRKCSHCSLEETCQPKAMNPRKLKEYMKALYAP
jgi:CRISPR-associated exonuclease Cas4